MNQLLVESAEMLRDWLEENHNKSDSIWLVKWKKDSGKPYISYEEIVDVLLCFGWIDSLPRKLNEEKSMLRISPRNPKSNWSATNKAKVEALMNEGKMAPSGIRAVNKAKENGTWDFLNDVEELTVPPDLKKELTKYDKAEYYFNRFPPSSKRGILEWIKTSKKETTREKRIRETAFKASDNIKANHPKGRDAGPKDSAS